MISFNRLRPILLAATAGIGMVCAAGQAQAGLFDFLFGSGQPAQPQYYPSQQPLEMRVSPRSRAKTSIRKEGPSKRVLAKSIDPVKSPSWYLEDPTLRRGDIVVLKGQILVYDGGRGQGRIEDFTALKDSRLVSKTERDRIQKMAGGQDTTTVERQVVATPKPTAAIEPELTKPGAAPEREAALRPTRR